MSSNAVWPPSLPQAPLIDGYSDTLPKTTVRTQMDAGPAKARSRFTAGVEPVKYTLPHLTNDQKETLKGFFNNTLSGGALSFDWIDPTQEQTTGLTGFGSCIRMAAASQFVRIVGQTFPTQAGSMTLEMWYKARDNEAPQALASQSGAWFFYQVASGLMTFTVLDAGPASVYSQFVAMPTDGAWHHYAWAFDGTSSKIYIDGVLMDSQNRLSGNAIATVTTPPEFGRFDNYGTKYYGDGFMDDVRLWTVKRSQAEIQAAMNSELVGTETNLWGYWKFSEQQGIIAYDSTAHDYDGMLIGARWYPEVVAYRFTTEPAIQTISNTIFFTASLELEIMP